MTSRWFVSRETGTPAGARVFCFPHAGGNLRTFLGWQAGLGADAEILAVCRPGREHRADEPAPTIEEYVDGATAAIRAACEHDDRPVYLFGHSLGALVAFEVTRRLAGLLSLRHLVASGCSAPSLLPSRRGRDIAKLEGRAFAEAVGFFGGVPAGGIRAQEGAGGGV